EARRFADDEGATEAELQPGESVSHYRVVSQLGAGGMGQVYLAQDIALGRKVALKLLPDDFTRDKDRVRRFQQEARAASALDHPNIIIDLSRDGKWLALARGTEISDVVLISGIRNRQ